MKNPSSHSVPSRSWQAGGRTKLVEKHWLAAPGQTTLVFVASENLPPLSTRTALDRATALNQPNFLNNTGLVVQRWLICNWFFFPDVRKEASNPVDLSYFGVGVLLAVGPGYKAEWSQ